MLYCWHIIGEGMVTGMQKLTEFLLKETPGHADELFTALNATIEAIGNTRALVDGNTLKLLQNGRHDEIAPYIEASKELMQLSSNLSDILEGVETDYSDDNDADVVEETESVNNNGNSNKYGSCQVNELEAHGLFESFTHKRPVSFSLEGQSYSARDWKQILRIVCEVLNQQNPQLFRSFVNDPQMQGSSRTYFSFTDKNMYNPRKISGSDVYVETNHSANTICSIISDILGKYNIPVTSIKIYLRADYTSLHEDTNVKKN